MRRNKHRLLFKKGLLLITVSLLNFMVSYCQKPGGIKTNNTLWLKSDSGVTINGSNTIWQEVSGANVTGDFIVSNMRSTPTTQTAPSLFNPGINFNPYIRFNGTTNSLTSTNQVAGDQLVSQNEVTVFQVFNLHGGTVWFKWETDASGSTARLGFERTATNNIRFDFPEAGITPWGRNIGVSSVSNSNTLSTCFADINQSTNRINGSNDNILPLIGITGDFSTGYMDYVTLGNEELINLPTQIDMAEFIIFSRLLTAAERNKVESYLAVKYGFTLNQAAINNNNYTASNDSIVWNRSANSLYANNITGIGRDDSSGLMQKQSKSINSTAIVTMYNGANYSGGIFTTLNSLNTSTFTNNLSYIIFGENAGATNAMTQCVYSNKAKSISRVWKVGRIGTDSLVTLSVDNGNIPVNATNIMVSSDSTFPSSKTTIYPLTIANGKVYASVVLGNNTFFTYTTDTLKVNIAVVQPSCNKPNSGSMSATISGAVSPYNYTWNTVPTQTNTSALNVSGGVYNLTVLMGSTCISTYPVTVKSGSLTALSAKASPDTFCHGFTTQLSVSIVGGTVNTFTWMPGGQKGTTIIAKPDTTTTFMVFGVDSSGCNDTAKIVVKVNPLPVISSITGNNKVCIGNTTQLKELTTGGVWTVSNSAIATIDTTGKVTGITNGNTTVKYIVTDKNGCKDSIPVPIVVNKPSVSNTPISICPSAFPYSWNGNVYNAIGSYVVHLTNAVGCDSAATLVLSSKAVSTSTTNTTVCTTALPYNWNGVNYNAAGAFTYHTTNAVGCDSAATLNLTVNSLSIDSIATSPALPILAGANFQVQIVSSSSIDSAVWTPAALFSNHQASQSITAMDTSFWVSVTGYSKGCQDTASKRIVVINTSVYIPNAFVPATTGNTDVSTFKIYGGSIKTAVMRIYNQWGQLIKELNDPVHTGWDGTYSGQMQPTGVYVYTVKITYLNNKTETKSGSINLIR